MIGRLVVLEVLSTNTLATIVWQDGTVEEEIPSNDLYPILHLDEREFFCGDYVTHSPEEGGSSKGDLHTYGVIQGVDHTSRTCHVKWFKTYQESAAGVVTNATLVQEFYGKMEGAKFSAKAMHKLFTKWKAPAYQFFPLTLCFPLTSCPSKSCYAVFFFF